MLKTILTFIWSVYAALVFAIILVLLIPSYLLAFAIMGEKFLPIALTINHQVLVRWVMLPLYLIRVKVKGREHIQKRPYVIISNHRSTIDILVNATAFPNTFQFLAKKEAGNLPLFGFLARQVCVLVDRKSPESRAISYQNMRKTIEHHRLSILLYPEGTRNRTTQPLQKFYDGAFRLAIETNTPILVQTLLGSGNVYPPFKTFNLRPGTIRVYFDQPIDTTDLTLADIPMLKQQVKALMLPHLAGEYLVTEFTG